MKKIFDILNRSDLSRRIVKGVSWSLIGSVVGKCLMLISFIYVARILGKEQYGKLGIIRSTVTMFLSFSSMGMGMTASRYIALYRNSDNYKAYQIYLASKRVSIIFGLIIAIIIIGFSSYIAKVSFGNQDLSLPLKLSALVLFFNTISSGQSGVLNGFEDFKSLGVDNSISGLVQAVMLITSAYFYGLNGVVFALGLSSITLFLLYSKSIRAKLNTLSVQGVRKIFDPEMKSIFIKFSLPAVFSGLVTLPIFWWTKTYLVKSCSFEEMAVFDVAEQWNMIFLFIPISISGIMLPMLTNTLVEGTRSQYLKLIKFNLLLNGGLTLIMVIIVIPLAPFILNFYGKSFSDYLPLQIMLVVAFFQAVNGVLGQVIASKSRMWLGLFINILWGVWLFVFSLLFIGKLSLGAVGLAYAMLASYFLHSLLQSIVAFKIKI